METIFLSVALAVFVALLVASLILAIGVFGSDD